MVLDNIMKITYDVFRSKTNNIIKETWICNEKLGLDETRQLFYALRIIRNKNSIGQLGYKLNEIYYNNNNIIYESLFNEGLKIKPAPSFERFWIDYVPAISKKCKNCYFMQTELNWCMMKNKKITKNLHFKCAWWMEKSMNNLEDAGIVYQCARSKENGGTNSRIHTYKGL